MGGQWDRLWYCGMCGRIGSSDVWHALLFYSQMFRMLDGAIRSFPFRPFRRPPPLPN